MLFRSDAQLEELLRIDTYREGVPAARTLKDIWPLALLVGATLFFADVFIRRVAIDFGWPLRKLAAFLSRRSVSSADQARTKNLDRLRTSKTRVSDDLEKQRGSLSFEVPDEMASSKSSEGASAGFGSMDRTASAQPTRKPESKSAESDDKENYTDRLLEAKRKAKRDKPS